LYGTSPTLLMKAPASYIVLSNSPRSMACLPSEPDREVPAAKVKGELDRGSRPGPDAGAAPRDGGDGDSDGDDGFDPAIQEAHLGD
jgi:hypothetical protein